MPRGRPVGSSIRQNIVELLYYMGEGYGYDIFKNYEAIFKPVTMRSIYYHLKKGIETEEFAIAKVAKEEGDYSWGSTVIKTYYKLGSNARPTMRKDVKEFFDSKK